MQFLYPNVFYMMLIPLILLILLVLTSKESIQQHFSKTILEKLTVGNRTLDKSTRNFLFFMTLIFFIIALGRPVANQQEQNIKQNLIPIVIALDVSKSMLATDIFPNRISLAKKKLKSIIELSKNSTIGILLFAKDSFVLSPVTEDFISLQYIVDNLDTNINFANGSNIFATLEATSYMLEEFEVKNLIILSDGGNDNKYTKEIEYANENNISIYSVGLATKHGSAIPDKNGYLTNKKGDIVTVKLNESIKNLSLKTNGGYIDFSLDNNDVKAIVNRINSQSKREDLSTQKIKTYTELFYYPLGLGLFILLLALSSFPTLRKKKASSTMSAIMVFMLFCIPIESDAYTFEFEHIEKAKDFYEKKEYSKASDEYRKIPSSSQSYYNLGNTLYKEGKYKEAIDSYSKVVTKDKALESQKLHNIGNSYVQSNNLEKAKEFYEKALKVKEDTHTKENLDAVNKELEKKKEQKQQNKDNKEQKKQDNKKEDKKQNKKQEKKDSNKKDSSKQKQSDKKKDDEQKKQNEKKDSKKKDKAQKDQESKEKHNNKEKLNQKATASKEIKKDEISNMEEKKWMNLLKNQKNPILLRKANTQKESKTDESQPW